MCVIYQGQTPTHEMRVRLQGLIIGAVNVAGCKHNADIVFALDASGSIEKDNFVIMEDYVRDVIYGLDVDGSSRVGVLTFGSNAQVRIDYSNIPSCMLAFY